MHLASVFYLASVFFVSPTQARPGGSRLAALASQAPDSARSVTAWRMGVIDSGRIARLTSARRAEVGLRRKK
jgi:hypothetical protein